MAATNGSIPNLTLKTLARTFFKEATGYGFTQVDYVKFVNILLDMAMKSDPEVAERSGSGGYELPVGTTVSAGLPLRGEHLIVRQFEPEQDLPVLDRWLADGWGRYFLLSSTTAQRLDAHEVVRSEHSVMGMITLPDSTPIGSVAFLDHDPAQKKAELRKLIGDVGQRRKGFGKEASALWIKYGLEVLNLKKIYLSTLNTNIRNIKLNEELGFIVEGILHNEVFIDGTYHDVLRMGLWRE
jgi:RimJ/RimL family protein N-acetyltransferase